MEINENEERLTAAFEVVLEAARLGVLDSSDAEMQDQVADQVEAVNQVDDFISNHWEKLEDNFGMPEDIVEVDLDALRALDVDHPLHQSMLTAIELSCQQYDEDLDHGGKLDHAINVAATFWQERGEEICRETITVGMDAP